MRVLMLVVAAACGGGSKAVSTPGSVRDTGRAALVAAAHDPAKLRALLRGSVVNGGLWFDDAACAQQFGVPGEVKSDRLDAFARCLATLKMTASPRESALGDVVIMRYPPGFELEARVVRGPQLAWIGYASRRSGDLDVPTITHDALEGLRLAGDRHGPLEPAVAAGLELDTTAVRAAFAWIKVCLDQSGRITNAAPFLVTTAKAGQAFAAATAGWKFRPFITRGKPLAVCSMVRMEYPVGDGPPVETLPMPVPPSRSNKPVMVFPMGSKLVGARRKSGNMHVLPDDRTKLQIQKSGVTEISGTFKLCVDDAGLVESVLPIEVTGWTAYDAKIIRELRAWTYEPLVVDGDTVPFCTAVIFIYRQHGPH